VLPPPRQTAPPSEPTLVSYSRPEFARVPEVETRRTHPIVIAGVVAIVLLLTTLVAIAAIYVIQHSGNTNANQANAESPTPRRPSPDPSKSREGDFTPSPSPNGPPLTITASASSVRMAVQANTYYASNAIDGQNNTAWIEGDFGPGEGAWIRFDFNREINLHRIIIQPGYFKSTSVWAQNNRMATMTAQFSDGSSRVLSFPDRMESQRIDLGSIKTRWVRLVIGSVYHGTDPGPNDDTALSEVAFEWEPNL
jgi:F5/8 type C domain